MRISSTQLEAFYAVARAQNFTKAAALINVTQSALSQRILNLEAELQTTLFIRDRSGIQLTETASKLLRYCQFQDKFETDFLNQLRANNSNELAGIIRIAGYSSILRSVILPCVKPLLLNHAQLQLKIQSMEMHELLNVLKSGETDYVITDYKIDREEVISTKIGVERNVLVQSEKISCPDVYLDHDENDEVTKKYLKISKSKSTKIKRHYLDDIYGLIDGVQAGLGKAVVPFHLICNLKGLRMVDPNIYLENPVYLSFYRQPFYSKLHNVLVETISEAAGKFLRSPT